MRVLPLLLLPLAACSRGELLVTPTTLDFGEVDFQEERPDLGYAPQALTIQNAGNSDLEVSFRDVDDTHLFIAGQWVETDPPTLSTLAPGAAVSVEVAVWDYEPGERDTLVEGAFVVEADGAPDPVTVGWSFTPIRVIGDDTGR